MPYLHAEILALETFFATARRNSTMGRLLSIAVTHSLIQGCVAGGLRGAAARLYCAQSVMF